jgi:type III secretion protein U
VAGAALNAVKKATVLIVNPTHLATALRYDEEEDQAPLILAQGQGDLARRMIDAAHAYGVPVVRDVPIAQALRDLEVGEEIPEALYEAVAEILREIWAQQQRGPQEP